MYLFTDDCLTGIREIDDEHRKLFQMINEALELLHSTPDDTVLTKNLLAGLKDYAAAHFAHEEAYMEKIKDPELPRQKKEHAAFAAKINSADSFANPEELIAYLTRWLYHHILGSDIMIGKLPPSNKSKEDPFAFTSKYLTGIEMVDEEHKVLFSIIREINDLIHAELLHDKYDEIIRIIGELKAYTEVHFSDEEAYMKKINYPGLDMQQRAHASFVERLVLIDLTDLDTLDDHQEEALEGMISFLLGWLSNHILKIDRLLGEFDGNLKRE